MLDKNPLQNIRNSESIRNVMINGVLYETDNMNEIYPEAKPPQEVFLGALVQSETAGRTPTGVSGQRSGALGETTRLGGLPALALNRVCFETHQSATHHHVSIPSTSE